MKAYGCQMNVYDSDRMIDMLSALGYKTTPDYPDADLVVLNTCHIREKAAEKVYSDLGRVFEVKAKLAAEGRRQIIAVTGCVAQAEGREIIRRMPFVDIVLGPQTYHHLPDLIEDVKKTAQAANKGAGLILTEFPAETKFDELPEISQPQGISAFLSVQEGCDKMCTFCVVPYTRGPEFSRPISAIHKEAQRLVSLGAKEITLLGQNVTAFHGEGPDGKSWSLARLLESLAAFDGIERLRYVTSHPRDMGQDIVDAHRDIDKLMPYLHLPFQAGSNKILKAMNRKYTANEYLTLIDKFKKARPDMAFATDIIVGFPGETDADFRETIHVVEQVGYAMAYSFAYSARPGTPAADREDQVPEEIKKERLAELQALLKKQQADFDRSMIGKTLSVLYEKPGRHLGQLVGRSPYLQPVHILGKKEKIGHTLKTKITALDGFSLMGVEGVEENDSEERQFA